MEFSPIQVAIKHRVLILTATSVITAIATIGSLFAEDTYTATATVLPIERSSGNLASLLSSMGGSMGLLASNTGLGGASASDKFITILQSRTINEAVITKHNLLSTLSNKRKWYVRTDNTAINNHRTLSMQQAVILLRKQTSFSRNKNGDALLISFTHNNPLIAAEVANTYISELKSYLSNNSLSSAMRSRTFIESQLNITSEALAKSESQLKAFQQKNSLISLEGQVQATLRTHADLKARLMSAQIELRLLESSLIQQDPRIELKKQEVSELSKQLKKLENSSKDNNITIQGAPSLVMELSRIKRELMVREKLFELLSQQYEIARIQEAQEDISFQVLDPAIPPEEKSGPRRALIVILALIGAFVFSVAVSFAYEVQQYKKRLTE